MEDVLLTDWMSKVVAIQDMKTMRQGTGTFILPAGEPYLITATHVITSTPNISIGVYEDDMFKTLHGSLALEWNGVTLIRCSVPVHGNQALDPRTIGVSHVALSATAWVPGFPTAFPKVKMPNSALPMPMVRRGAISYMGGVQDPSAEMFIDTVSSPGMSGSPVITQLIQHGPPIQKMIGVVQGVTEGIGNEPPWLRATILSRAFFDAAEEAGIEGLSPSTDDK